MLEFSVWRDLSASFVRLHAARLGWSLQRIVHSKSTRSLYLYLTNGTREVSVRLSDHRSRRLRRSCFSVSQSACGRLSLLAAFLAVGRYVPTLVDAPKRVDVSIPAGEATTR